MWIPKCVHSFVDWCIVIYAKTRNPQQNLKNRNLYVNVYLPSIYMLCNLLCTVLRQVCNVFCTYSDRRLRNIVEKDLYVIVFNGFGAIVCQTHKLTQKFTHAHTLTARQCKQAYSCGWNICKFSPCAHIGKRFFFHVLFAKI